GNLAASLAALQAAVAPGGRLVIVEDVLDRGSDSASARRVVGDWLLAKLYTEADYVAALGRSDCEVVDLTSAVRSSGRLSVAGRLLALNAIVPWLDESRATAIRAFRGGLHLESLYRTGAMRYKAFIWRGSAAERAS